MDMEFANHLWAMYQEELVDNCSSGNTSGISFKDFMAYADRKEAGESLFVYTIDLELMELYFPTELWHIFHDELDLDNNGHLDAEELAEALGKAGAHFVYITPLAMNLYSFKLGINLNSSTLSEFMTFLTSSPHSHAISFPEFRDFLLLLPRPASTKEIFRHVCYYKYCAGEKCSHPNSRYYEVRKSLGDDGRGAARVNMEGMISFPR